MKVLNKKTVFIIIMMILSVVVKAQTTTVKHTVDRGETLSSIAKRYNTTEVKIIELNPDARQFVYVGMELTIPATTISKISYNDELPKAQENVTNTNSNYKESAEGFYGLFFHSYLTNDAFKYGGIVEFEGAVLSKCGIGGDFSVGMPIQWKPEFSVTSALVGLGPCYGVKLSRICELYVPMKVMCSLWSDSNDNFKAAWSGRINPTILLGKNNVKFAFGAYCDIAKKTSFGLTIGLTYM